MKFCLKFRSLFLVLLCTSVFFGAQASHNVAGEITYETIGDPNNFEYRFTLVTYTLSESLAAHRTNATLNFGYGSPEKTQTVRFTIEKEPVPPEGSGIWRNVYIFTHRFPGPGCYTVSYSDPNRIGDILNINEGKSDLTLFYVETDLCINTALGLPYNNSPLLLERPISYACLGQRYVHNPNAYDPDGDSLVFSLIPPKSEKGMDVPRYVSPEQVSNIGSFTIDAYTGELIWDRPMRIGKYNIAIYIEEYRRVQTNSGPLLRRVGAVTRDMQIIVKKCNNNPPEIQELEDICVEAGGNNVVNFSVTATDVDREFVTLTASGGPFIISNSPANNFGTNEQLEPVTANFTWRVDCSHIRKEPYRVVFNATDKGNGVKGQELSDIKHVDIRVVGPKPLNLRANGLGNGIQLEWERPNCQNLVAYFIYRKAGASNWVPGDCEIGVPDYTGFRQVAIVDNPQDLSFYDNNNGAGLNHGIQYCYRITALYLSEGQFEAVQGFASNESCAELIQDVPIIYEASVLETDEQNGENSLKWTDPVELDTLQYLPPYQYVVMEAVGFESENYSEIARFSANSYTELVQNKEFIKQQLNTFANARKYKIDFYYTNTMTNEFEVIGTAKAVSTPFLEINSGFRKLELVVKENVSWVNTEYTFYRLNEQTNQWDSIGTSETNTFLVQNLTNGLNYCFKARATGSFFVANMPDPIINFSQEACGIPIDTIPPCPPVIEAEANCDLFQNSLNWTYADPDCAFDVIGYRIYFSHLGTEPFEQIAEVDGDAFMNFFIDDRDTLRRTLAGCYQVTAIDSYYNESTPSNSFCVDNCPDYQLPNVFTPNGDAYNELFRPFPYKFVDSFHINIFNRWGQEVFNSNNPDILWDGQDILSKKPLSSGVYYYVAKVYFYRLYENQEYKMQGIIHLLR